jgi:NADH:ubiquinone reductase (non-electrogenic)
MFTKLLMKKVAISSIIIYGTTLTYIALDKDINDKKKICIIGSGWGSYTFNKHINHNKYDVTVISPTPYFTYTPLLAQDAVKDLTSIIKKDVTNLNKNINYIQNTVDKVNLKEMKINNSHNIYDYIIFAYGADVNTFNIQGVKDNCLFLKTQDDANKIKHKLNQEITANYDNNCTDSKPKIAVIGAGPTGAELIGHLSEYKDLEVIAIDGLKPLNMCSPDVSEYTMDLWKNQNVNTYFGKFVKEITKKSIKLSDKTEIPFDIAVWCGGVKMRELTIRILTEHNDLNKKYNGIPVNCFLNTYLNHHVYQNVFAIGDCSHHYSYYDLKSKKKTTLPPTAQVASQQGKYLANIFNNEKFGLKPFQYKNKGILCYIGNNESVYENDYFNSKGYIANVFRNIFHIYQMIKPW